MVEQDFYIVMGIIALFIFLAIILRALKESSQGASHAH